MPGTPRRTSFTFALLLGAGTCALMASCKPSDPALAVPKADPAVAKAIATSKETHPAAWDRKVMVLGFDSCDGDLVDDMIRRGKLPNFAKLRRDGAYGLLASAPPLLSPIVWTTIATGMPAERHGILDFVTKQGTKPVPVSSSMRTADTMWEVLARHGESVGVVGWLVTYPADPLPNSFIVTDRMGLLAFEYGRERSQDAAKRTYPEELAAEIDAKDRVTIDDLPLSKVRPFANVSEEDYARDYSTVFQPDNRLGNLRLTLATAETFRRAGERLYAERRPRFFACYFEAMDALSHVFMRYAPPKMPNVDVGEYEAFKTAIEANYMWHDQVLGEFMALADDKTTIFLISDHGFKSGELRRDDSSDFHAKTGAQWHRSYGVIYAWGYGVAKGVQIKGASVYDIAPTVLASMGYPAPDDMRGNVLTDAFAGGLSYERVPTYYGDSRRDVVAGKNAAAGDADDLTPEQQAAMDRLVSIGYISGTRSDSEASSINLGTRFMVEGRIDDALEKFQSVWDGGLKNPGVASSIGSCYVFLGKLDEAEKWAEIAVGMDPSDVGSLVLLARVHIRRRRFPQAESVLETALVANSKVPQVHLTKAALHEAAAEAAEKAGDKKLASQHRLAAIESYRAALKLEPNDSMTRATLAGALLALLPSETGGHVDPLITKEALDHLDAALALTPTVALWQNNRAIALLRLGMLAAADGRADEEEAYLTSAVAAADSALDIWRKRTTREYAKAWANRGYALWIIKRLPEAFESAQKARVADPRYVFNAQFMAELAKAGHVIPPPAPPEPEPATPPEKAGPKER